LWPVESGFSTGKRHHLQAEDIFLTPRAWRVGIAIVLTNCKHRITGELVDSKVLMKGAYSANRRSAVRWTRDDTHIPWSDLASLTVVLLLSLGVWAAIWEAVASLASAVLQ
jgi:hypothetical protein